MGYKADSAGTSGRRTHCSQGGWRQDRPPTGRSLLPEVCPAPWLCGRPGHSDMHRVRQVLWEVSGHLPARCS